MNDQDDPETTVKADRDWGLMKVIGHESSQDSKDKQLFAHVVRFCYRKRFPPIHGTNITSDRGWGCCYRSCQGIVAQYVLSLYKSYPSLYATIFNDADPLSLFYDMPTSPFSIHNLVLEAAACGLPPGSWAKPSLVAVAIQNICTRLGLSCVLTTDFVLKSDEISTKTYPCLLLIPGLFGLQGFDLTYLPFLQLCICVHESLGFVSGKKNSAYYIAGFNAKGFAFFDPHTTKKYVSNPSGYSSFYDIGYSILPFKSINPSVLLGFLCGSLEELNSLVTVLLGCGQSPIGIVSSTNDLAIDDYVDMEF